MLGPLETYIVGLPTPFILLILAAFIYVLGKGADLLVEKAVDLSSVLGVPKVLIGATVVSLGTTLPEASVSVLAAIQGNPGMALGNAVGSIICDTGLILGLGATLSPLPLDRKVVNRQGWVQLGAAFLLILLCLPYSHLGSMFSTGGHLPRWGGFLFVILLVGYFVWSYQQSKHSTEERDTSKPKPTTKRVVLDLAIMALGIAMVIIASKVLIVSAEEVAHRMKVPESVIAASLVAFGTSLPELITVITSIRRGHGELAVGNVIGADILNVLFVAGTAAAVTPGGLNTPADFFKMHFIAMIGLLLIFRIAILVFKTKLPRSAGITLLAGYVIYLAVSLSTGGALAH